MSTITWLRVVFWRDLESLAAEVAAYPDDAALWRAAPGIANPGGTLALHLAGNMRHFIGAELAGTGYVRDRDAEFGTRDLSRAEVRRIVEAARDEVDAALAPLDDGALERPFPVAVAGVTLSTGQFLIHLAAHLGYHLGQLDYHRRITSGGGSVAGMQAVKALAVGR
jgi:uncharacterized damage-inducible protein DinB